MTNRQFIHSVRQYARAARRLRKSYAEQVLALRDLFLNAPTLFPFTASERAHRTAWADDVIRQEYASADSAVLDGLQ
jgi:hypothetical protein